MPTARKRGDSWRVKVYLYKDADGKEHYKSITAPTKTEAEQLAAEYKNVDHCPLTFEQAAREYIALRTNALSPRTVEDYKRTLRLYCGRLSSLKIYKVTGKDVQTVVNDLALTLSPKTVSNAHAFISSVLKAYRPSLALNTRLPQRTRPDLYIPTDDDIKALLKRLKGTALELPVLLAAFGPMRRGEICALSSENISGNTVHVCENMVKDTGTKPRKWVIRHPKSYQGDRFITYPDFVSKLWEGKDGRLVNMTPDVLTSEFRRYLKQGGFPEFRFHDLRHYSASIQHALGVPDAYIMARGGWSTDAVLKSVYRHAMSDREKEINDKINGHFDSLLS